MGYVAAEKLSGISKLTRIVGLYSKRFTSQERLSHDIGNTISNNLQPGGDAVYIEAEHFCMQARGVRELSSRTGILVMRGAYNQNAVLSEEFPLMYAVMTAMLPSRHEQLPGFNSVAQARAPFAG